MKASKFKKAFTLIEVIIAMAIFDLAVGSAVGLFYSSLRSQRLALVDQKLMDETSFVAEYMSRSLRMARKDLTGTCIATAGSNYETNVAFDRIRFLNYQNFCQEFFLDTASHQLKERKSTDDTDENFALPQALTSTSADLVLESFRVGPSASWDEDDTLQPKVTIFFNLKTIGRESEFQPGIKIQTTVSQRNLDVHQ